MELFVWIRREVAEGRAASRFVAIKTLSDAAAVSVSTIRNAEGGRRIVNVDVARRISDATNGDVSIDDLCPPRPA